MMERRSAAIEATWLAHLATPGGVLLTATHRQAAHVLAVHARAARGSGHRAWVRAAVFSWGQWLAALCAAASARGALPPAIDANQSRLLWGEVIRDWEGAEVGRRGAGALVSRPATVEAVVRAWRTWLEAGLAPAALQVAGSDEESVCLAAWVGEYRRRLDALGLIDLPLAEQRLPEVLAPDHLVPARHLLLVGFLELAPVRRHLLAACEGLGIGHAGAPAADAPALPPSPGFTTVHAPDPETERRAAAAWARARLAADPEARLAIVVPELDRDAPDLVRVLEATLQPRQHYGGSRSPADPVYDLAHTPSLAGRPVIADALAILGCGRGPLPAATWTRLLLSPCIAGATEELPGRIRVDRSLRLSGLEPWPAARVIAAAEQDAPCWARLFAGLAAEAHGEAARPVPPSAWARRFQERLAAVGWPGETGLDDPALHQTVEGLVGCLETLASLDALLPHLDAAGALERLTELVAARRFRPRGSPCRLDVIPPDELPGLAWDGVWVLGQSAASFPEPIRPPAFLPAGEVNARALPGSAAAQLARARRWLAALSAATPQATLSAPRQVGDEVHGLAPLLTAWLGAPGPLPGPLAAAFDPLPALALEAWQDPQAPALPAGRHAGSRQLLQDQSECPFRAWALRRVRAEPPPTPARAVEARHRGEWVHAALAALWRCIGDSPSLAAADEATLAAWVEAAVAAAAATMGAVDTRLRGSRFLRIESERLRGLLREWLAVERGRGEAFTVTAVETEIPCAIGALDLRLRPDRVDRLASGERVVVDYKQRPVTAGRWLPPRPRDPQPALYALALGEPPPVAVLFARPDTPETPFSGFAADAERQARFGLRPVKGAPAEFPMLLAGWRLALEALAHEFAAGLARVSPQGDACRYCEVGPLCRIDASRREVALELAAEATEEAEETDEIEETGATDG
jgi:exodeoxyribonuclease-5